MAADIIETLIEDQHKVGQHKVVKDISSEIPGGLERTIYLDNGDRIYLNYCSSWYLKATGIVRSLALGLVVSLLVGNVVGYQAYNMVIDECEDNFGREIALKYARQNLNELHAIKPGIRFPGEWAPGAELFLKDYIVQHYAAKRTVQNTK